MPNVGGMRVETLLLGSVMGVQHYYKRVSRAGMHGGSADAGSGRKEVKEKGDEEDWVR